MIQNFFFSQESCHVRESVPVFCRRLLSPFQDSASFLQHTAIQVNSK
jgi:hypothetical protein